MKTELQHWLYAVRLRTLPLALASILMGSLLAASQNYFSLKIFLMCVLTTVCLQILSNLANDYGDSIHGADSTSRVGPARAVQSGAISISAMRTAVIVFSFLSLLSGLYLLYISFGTDWRHFVVFLGAGLLSIAAAIGYTVGRRPYGYVGLGDISVLIFFGITGVVGSYYLFTKNFDPVVLLPALSCGFFATGVLNVNNIRDIDSDRAAGKFSLPVRLGREKAVFYHWMLLLGGISCAVGFTLIRLSSPWQFLFLITVPLFIRNARAVKVEPSSKLDPYLKQLAISTLLFVILFGIGMLLA